VHVRYHAPNALHPQEPLHVHPVVQTHERPFSASSLPRPEPDSGRLNRRIKMQQTENDARPNNIRAHNGMPAGELAVTWQKSRRSNPSGNCVEMAALPDGSGIAVRNSRDPEGPALIFTNAEISAFVLGAGDGDFNNLVA
jgi:hypothetical protein